jgi:hypothetical protein
MHHALHAHAPHTLLPYCMITAMSLPSSMVPNAQHMIHAHSLLVMPCMPCASWVLPLEPPPHQ